MVDLNKDDLALITQAIAIGFSPAGVALDVADLARASYNLYQEKSDDNYFEVILCVIGFIPGPGDGLKAGLRIVNRKPEILFELIRFIMTHCKIYGNPEQWLSEIISDAKIRELIRSGKREALNASNKNIGNRWAKYWINQSIEITFNFLEASISSLVQLLARKVLHWKKKVPKSSADKGHTGGGKGHQNGSAHGTTYDGKTGQNGNGQGNKGRRLSKADISKVLSNLEVGGVGEHMADYWVADKLAIQAIHDSGQQLSSKLQRPMTKLHVGIHDQGIDAIWKSDKKDLGIMNTKNYAVIEAKASLSMGKGTGPGSLLNDLDKQQDTRDRHTERSNAKKEKRPEKKLVPKQKYLINQQMSEKWVEARLSIVEKRQVLPSYSRHLLYFNYAHPETVEHLNTLAVSIQDQQPIDHTMHLNEHTPSNFWGAAKIDEALNNRVTRANAKNGHTK
ncbi:hypothetical protein [Acinetobacter bereziniae]|uniref:hypothetical protein n=1 Tax=Acinetobacter bereziniae TaxID=106648 RepID=UPI0019024959|nr:hypothetical protein [Acinetobacter bereziniae]MBJ9908837.1 hypothetical protein [Acinetobacter bereziniae]MBJ9930092.1 hypothetical protein [Acinetobacter bereziniae]